MKTTKIKFRRLPWDKVKIITTATKVTEGGAKTTPTACALALRVNGKWGTEASLLPRGASVPTYRCVGGSAPAAAWRNMCQYYADLAERNLARCGELLNVYRGELHAAHICRIQAASAKYAASLAKWRKDAEDYASLVKEVATSKRQERERKEAEIVRNGSSAYVDDAAEKATLRYIKIEERVNKREAAKAANAVKAA